MRITQTILVAALLTVDRMKVPWNVWQIGSGIQGIESNLRERFAVYYGEMA